MLCIASRSFIYAQGCQAAISDWLQYLYIPTVNTIIISNIVNTPIDKNMVLNDNVVNTSSTVMIQSQNVKTVMLQVDIKETTRTRLKLQAVRLNTTMGSLADQILTEALEKMEKQQ